MATNTPTTPKKPANDVQSTEIASPSESLLGLVLRAMCVGLGKYEEINIPARGDKAARLMRKRTYTFSDQVKAYTLTDWDEQAVEPRFEFGKTYAIAVDEASIDRRECEIKGDPIVDL